MYLYSLYSWLPICRMMIYSKILIIVQVPNLTVHRSIFACVQILAYVCVYESIYVIIFTLEF